MIFGLAGVAGQASAMTASTPAGHPGEVVTLTLESEQTHPGFHIWYVYAPTDTTFVGVPSVAGPGGGTVSCLLITPVEAQCLDTTWPANRQLTAQLIVDADAHGTLTGSSVLEDEEVSYSVLVLALQPPTFTTPVDHSISDDQLPLISGSKGAGNSVLVTASGETVCSVPADAELTWSCHPTQELPFGSTALVATQSNLAGDSSPPASITVGVRPPPLEISYPPEHASVSGPGVRIDGTGAVSDATVIIGIDGHNIITTVLDDGRWSTQSALELGPGQHQVVARQTVDGIGSPPVSRTFRVVGSPPPATPQPSHHPTPPEHSASTRPPSPPPTRRPPTPKPSSAEPPVGTPTSIRPSSEGGRATSSRPRSTSRQPVRNPNRPVRQEPSPTGRPRQAPASPVPDPPSGQPSNPAAPEPERSQPGEAAANAYFPVDLNMGGGQLLPGRVASLVGRMGPNASENPITVTFHGSLNKGILYRGVETTPKGECRVITLQFSCTVVLQPGEEMILNIRLLADSLKAPDVARQRLTVSTSDSTLSNTVTSTARVVRSGSAAQSAEPITGASGSFAVLLSLNLLALAAVVARRRR